MHAPWRVGRSALLSYLTHLLTPASDTCPESRYLLTVPVSPIHIVLLRAAGAEYFASAVNGDEQRGAIGHVDRGEDGDGGIGAAAEEGGEQ